MINASKTLVLVSIVLAASLLTGCSDETKNDGQTAAEILADREASAAPYALIRLQETPTFPVDDGKNAFAMEADRDERSVTKDQPLDLGS